MKFAVAKLEREQIMLVLPTGDNAPAANYIASEAGIKEVHSDLLSEDKMAIIKGFDTEGKCSIVTPREACQCLLTSFK